MVVQLTRSHCRQDQFDDVTEQSDETIACHDGRGGLLFGAGCNVPGGGVSAPVPTIAVPRAPDPPARALPPVRFPQDEGPHDVLAEWWYYTGHLYAPAKDFPKAFGAEPQALRLPDEGGDDGPYADEREFGFEFVIFRGFVVIGPLGTRRTLP